ncbi:MAG: zf-HC2 domain-containing protein [Candidatus Sulfotelmatobacter sp.]|jgi:predicted anti-sigma-YlaC factor YlaD
MTRDAHDEARELIAVAGANDKDLSGAQQTWLRAHLQECVACRDYAEGAGRMVRALRSQPLAADSALVRATQMRVRSRVLELQRQQERLWVICVCCFAVTLGTAFTTAVLWRGFAWVGQQARLPSPVWQIGLVVLGLMPAIVAGILLLARGTYLADHNGSLPNWINGG